MLAWLTANIQLFQDDVACLKQLLTALDLSTAIGAQLDLIGVIVGQSRTVNFQPGGPILTAAINAAGTGYTVNDIVTVVQIAASLGKVKVTSIGGGGAVTGISLNAIGVNYSTANGVSTTGGTGGGLTLNITASAGSPILDDTTYRQLLQCRIFQNHWNGQIDSLQAFWTGVFPGGSIVIDDAQNMTATVIVSGSFTPIITDLIINGYIVPRPQAVLYTYLVPELPMLGFDESTPFIAGFDLGHFV